jgi:hypothetical protein
MGVQVSQFPRAAEISSYHREMARRVISEFSIYTIAHPSALADAVVMSQSTLFEEKKAWTTGCVLWNEAEAAGTAMPILFGDATDCSRLVYWGILANVVVENNTTQYSVERLREIKGRCPQELELRTTGKRIAPNFIRPYAICRTPPFLPKCV